MRMHERKSGPQLHRRDFDVREPVSKVAINPHELRKAVKT